MSAVPFSLGAIFDGFDASPWGTGSGRRSTAAWARHDRSVAAITAAPAAPVPLYTAAERARRDATPWTLVQGILAPVQFAVFAISLALVLHFLATGTGYGAATVSIVAKTLSLYAIMVTGSIWERKVFGRWLFAPAFYWEDLFSLLVIALHTAYLVALVTASLAPSDMMLLALAAYASYLVNAAQFVMKLRAARRTGDALLDAAAGAA